MTTTTTLNSMGPQTVASQALEDETERTNRETELARANGASDRRRPAVVAEAEVQEVGLTLTQGPEPGASPNRQL